MNVRVDNTGPCRKKLFISTGADEVSAEYKLALKFITANAEIKGFRKGKAPEELVEKEYRAEIDKRTQDVLLSRLYRDAIQKEEIKVVEIINVEITDYSLEKGISFTVEVDVRPEFELPDYSAIKVKKNIISVSEEDIDKAIEDIRLSRAKYEEVGGAKADDGDIAVVDFEGTCDGVSIKTMVKEDQWLGESKDRMLIVGTKKEIIPGLNQTIRGLTGGTTFEFDTEFPIDYFVKELAGKKAHYKFVLKSVRKQIKPELDDKFLDEIGVKNMEDFRKQVRETLQIRIENIEKQKVRNEIIGQLLKMSSFEIPQSLKDSETRMALYEIVDDLTRKNVDKKTLDGKKDEILNEARKIAEERVRINYLLHRIAEKEKLLATKEELDKAIHDIAERRKTKADLVRKEFEKDARLADIEHDITIGKTLDFLEQKVTVVDA
ncbi:TPA: trigger factor [bacterium]|nr:trigger factor [bacterium]